ncbi:MAG: LysM peptidoglycan-binding domain-containing protein [Anaerolineae bacterium]
MRKTEVSLATTALMLLLSVAVTVAQGTCSEFVNQALDRVNEACEGIGRNQACYGFNRVEASFYEEVAEGFFSQPADLAEVVDLETLRTTPYDLVTDQWGVAVMVLQANMPETLPGQNVTFILMGDTEIESAIPPEEAYDPITGIEVTVTFPQGAAIRSGPGDNFNQIGGVVVGTTFNTDGLSEDGNWVRVVWEGRPAWVRRTTLDPIPEIETLPVLNADLRTPMQAFYLRTGIGQPTCNEVPDNSLLIQGPQDIEIQLGVNGADIELGSSGILRVIEQNGEPALEIVVLDGEFVVKADEFNAQDVVIRAGERSTLCLEGGNDLGVNGQPDDLVVSCEASPPELVPLDDLRDAWCSLENLPDDLLNYPLNSCLSRTHTVQAGENLFRISTFYCVTQSELASLNGIVNPDQIFVGQVLTLPATACEGGGVTRPPASVVETVEETEEDTTNTVCDLRLLSPLAPVNSGNHTFSWTDAGAEAASYQLLFFDYQGVQVQTFSTQALSYTLNLGQQTATGGEFSWEVRAFRADESFLCSSGRSPQLVRTGELNPPASDLRLSCVMLSPSLYEATVSWDGLASGVTVSVILSDGSLTTNGGPFTGTSGSQSITLAAAFGVPSANASTSDGATVSASC